MRRHRQRLARVVVADDDSDLNERDAVAPKMDGPGYEIKDRTAAIAVGKDLEILGMSLQNAPQYLEDRPLKHEGFGNVAGDSQKATQQLNSAIDSLILSMGYAQNVIDATGAAIKKIMSGYEAREADARSSFSAEDGKVS